jgi:hypothetical protein
LAAAGFAGVECVTRRLGLTSDTFDTYGTYGTFGILGLLSAQVLSGPFARVSMHFVRHFAIVLHNSCPPRQKCGVVVLTCGLSGIVATRQRGNTIAR